MDARPPMIAACWGVGWKILKSVKTDTTADSFRFNPSKLAKRKDRSFFNGIPSVAPYCWRFAGGLTRVRELFVRASAKGSAASRC